MDRDLSEVDGIHGCTGASSTDSFFVEIFSSSGGHGSAQYGERCTQPCLLCHFCHGNSIVSTVSNTVLATVHVSPGVGIIRRDVQFGGFVVWSPVDPQFSATLVPPAKACFGLLYGGVLRQDHPMVKTILKVFQGAYTKEGEPGPIW